MIFELTIRAHDGTGHTTAVFEDSTSRRFGKYRSLVEVAEKLVAAALKFQALYENVNSDETKQ